MWCATVVVHCGIRALLCCGPVLEDEMCCVVPLGRVDC